MRCLPPFLLFRPAGWCGAAEAQQRCSLLTEELLAFLEALAASTTAAANTLATNAATTATAAGHPPRPGTARLAAATAYQAETGAVCGQPQQQQLPQQWLYCLRLAAHCCTAGLLDAAQAAEWAASWRVLLPLPPAGRVEVLRLMHLCLPAAQLTQQQVLSLVETCTGSAAEGEAAAAAASDPDQAAALAELRRGLVTAAATVVALQPAAFVSAGAQPLALALGGLQEGAEPAGGSDGGPARHCGAAVDDARRRLARALHARWVGGWEDECFAMAGNTLKALQHSCVQSKGKFC